MKNKASARPRSRTDGRTPGALPLWRGAAGVCAVAVALLLAALAALSFLAGRENYGNRLLVTPASFGTPGLNTEKLEEFCKEEFLLTYEIRKPAMARAANTTHTVTLVGTNPHYAHIVGDVCLDGGFFTGTAMDTKQRHAVLNKAAAFAIFGSSRISGSTLKLDGETWLVVGVVQDGDTENLHLYVPASVTGGQADSVMALMDHIVTEAYAKNALKRVGIHDTRYDFINLSKSAAAFGGRFAVAWKTAASAALLLFLAATAGTFRAKFRFYRDRMRDLYARELLAHHRADLLKTAGGILLFAAGVGAMLALSLQILATCLTWQELTPITGELAAGDFGHRLLWLRDYRIPGRALFGSCVCLTLLCAALVLTGRKRELSRPNPNRMRKYGQPEHYPV